MESNKIFHYTFFILNYINTFTAILSFEKTGVKVLGVQWKFDIAKCRFAVVSKDQRKITIEETKSSLLHVVD